VDAIEVRAFPRKDDSFNQVVVELTNALDPDDPAILERALRRAYPRVRVTAQSSLATLGGFTVWYVFRDGRAPIGQPDGER
jgi:hypothetical protein